jgi:uncharacterized protein YkwD
LLLAAACSNVLDYDSVRFEQEASGGGGAEDSGAGGNLAAGGRSGDGGALQSGGTSAAGGSGMASGGGPSAGGAGNGGSNGARGGASGAAAGGGAGAGGSEGGASGSGGAPGAGGATGDHYETETQNGGTGKEPGGVIPVCCVPSANEKSGIERAFDLLNQHRLANGASALAYDLKLEAAIEGHVHHMGIHTFTGHTAPEAGVANPLDRARLCGATPSAWGENLYWGQTSPDSAINWWKQSSGHNQNMLSGNFNRVGIGNYAALWGQLFSS